MSTVLTMPPTLPYRCPDCGSIDWYRDGCLIAENEAAAGLTCGRVQRLEVIADSTWSCTHCAHEVLPGSRLEHDLEWIRSTTCHEAAS